MTISAYEEGRDSGQVAHDVLFKGVDPFEIGVKTAQVGIRHINVARAEELGLDIPSAVLVNAQVYQDFSVNATD